MDFLEDTQQLLKKNNNKQKNRSKSRCEKNINQFFFFSLGFHWVADFYSILHQRNPCLFIPINLSAL